MHKSDRFLAAVVAAVGFSAFAGLVRGQDAAPPPAPAPAAPQPDARKEGAGGPDWQRQLDGAARELSRLNAAQAPAAPGQDVERLQKQVEIQQKQIEALLKMTQLLAEQVKKQSAAGRAVDDLQERVASQEAKAQQSARRDQDLARAHDDLNERIDAEFRNGPTNLPPTLREKFLPTRTNESPLAIYGTVVQEFQAQSGFPTNFRDRSLMLRPYLLLNENWLFSGNFAIQTTGVQLWRAQLERFINDNLTFVAGRFYSPVGFFSERLRLPWVIKTVDPPLMFNQVYPINLSFDGVQLRGARYLGDSPVKLEYNGFLANGLSVPGAKLAPAIYSNLNNFTDSIDDVNHAKAAGGRLGLSVPSLGLIVGLSGLANGSYDQARHNLNLWDFDVNYHRGNWDFRLEYARMYQQVPAITPIRRKGLYAQVAYRRYNSPNPYLQKLEGVFRFDHVVFDGIDVAKVGIGFGGNGPNVDRYPLDRNRYTLGLNYWFYPSLALKLDYEIYDELGVPSIRDNAFVAQLVWGW
jgi:hypothetical protein